MLTISPPNETRHLIELSESYQCTQLLKAPARVTSSSKPVIDLFLTDEPDIFVTSGVSHIGCSDDSLIYVSRKLTCPRSFPQIDWIKTIQKLCARLLYEWHGPGSLGHDGTNRQSYKSMGGVETLFLAVVNLHAPVKKKRIWNSEAPWLTPEIKRLMWERDRTKRIATVTNDQLKWAEYTGRRLKNRVSHSIKASKKDYYHSYFEDNVGKAEATWNEINTLLSLRRQNWLLVKRW